jgi:hypothetical protein
MTMLGRSLRRLVAGYNAAVEKYSFARLEIAASHPRSAAPPVIERLGPHGRSGALGSSWPAAIRQLRAADGYVRAGASAVLRHHPAWAALAAAYARIRMNAAAIESTRTRAVRLRRAPGRRRERRTGESAR